MKKTKFDLTNVKDKVLYADMRESLKQGNSHIVYESEDTLVLRENEWNLYYIASHNFDELDEILDKIIPTGENYEDYPMLLPRGDELIEHVIKKTGYTGIENCYQLMYDGKEPIETEAELEIRHPDPEDYEKIAATYRNVDEDVLKRNFADPHFVGGYINAELAGYAGMHQEGSLGMLHIFEKYRGRGYAQQLEAHIINTHLKEGRLPYGQVFDWNTASLELQKKLGLKRSEEKIAWLWME